MRKQKGVKSGFTLIEVMVAVVIISTVIMALIQMYANNIHLFSSLKAKTEITQYGSVFLSNPDMGFEKKETTLYNLLDGFDVEDNLRHYLKSTEVKVTYQTLQTIDLADLDGEKEASDMQQEDEEVVDENQGDETEKTNMLFEIGRTTLSFKEGSVSILRILLK